MVIETKVETIDGIEYRLLFNDYGPAVRILDVEVFLAGSYNDGVVAIINYPSLAKAQEGFDVVTNHAREVA
ncbi:MAG TPA: hypothetical protein ENH62_12260 [Marinobacter sp.]|uniref:Uncharacterized protein n=1 Tax=marine sediment metagenome TaxID=412755 RepID=A0A0F9Q7T5_9ZZZZ|nr:hypothetical protein [Marinobacter sp.]